MRHGDRESTTDSDPHSLLFGPSEDDSFLDYDEHSEHPPRVQRVSRSQRRAEAGHHARRRRSRRAFWLLSTLLVVVVAAAVWLVGVPIYHWLNPADYSGNGTGTVIIEVKANDGADAIGKTLHDKDVVASVRAFTDAAKDDSRSQSIQPGAYKLHKHMSAKNALALLLDPAARVNSDVVVTEGATTLDVFKRLTAPPCDDNAPASKLCGPGLKRVAVTKALENVKAIGLPTDFTVGGKTPLSVEGFLYPATYYFPEDTSPLAAVQQMVTEFTDNARSTNFTAQAKTLHITPYQELIIASIAQSEAKFPEDYGKVARVILNRLAAGRRLQVDATSAYPAKLKGLDPASVLVTTEGGLYNTYQHDGLPPTPISNPGRDAMDGAAHPAAGNWLYYVNGDADGHLFFTASEVQFEKAVEQCRIHHWGCG